MTQDVCEFCLIVNNQVEAEDLYEDELCRAVLHLKPATPGQVLIFPKQHYPILEHVPDEVVRHLFTVSNKLGAVLFDSLNIQGTNLIVQNGVAAGQSVAHFSINIVPRAENDGLNLQWMPQQLSQEDMDAAREAITAALRGEPSAPSQKETAEPIHSEEGELNYLVEQLKRIP